MFVWWFDDHKFHNRMANTCACVRLRYRAFEGYDFDVDLLASLLPLDCRTGTSSVMFTSTESCTTTSRVQRRRISVQRA